jgi:hypothetical protein
MLSKYFVALKFKNDSALYRTIDGFKKRFDPKYKSDSFPHMSMLAPFQMDTKDEFVLAETLKEEAQTFFYGHEGALKLDFSGIEITKHHKKHMLFLNPVNIGNMEFCIDLVQSICEPFVARNTGYKQNKKQLLQLASFYNTNDLYSALEDLKEQSLTKLGIKVDSIVLMKKSQGNWQVQDEIFKFQDNFDELLQIQTLAL